MHEVRGSSPLAPTIKPRGSAKKMAETIDYKEQIQKLIRLQETDSEIYELQSEKDSFPEKIAALDGMLEKKKNGMNEAEEKLKQLQVKNNDKDNELKSCEDKILKHEGELAQIKTNKEYKAMLEQIESVKADISLLEEGIIGIMDEIEAAKARCEEEKKLFEEEKKKNNSEKESIRNEEKQVDARLNELKGIRGELKSGIAEDLLTRYEKIRENRGKYAIARIEGDCCGVCNMTLRPQVINEARLQKGLVICETCSRILYSDV